MAKFFTNIHLVNYVKVVSMTEWKILVRLVLRGLLGCTFLIIKFGET